MAEAEHCCACGTCLAPGQWRVSTHRAPLICCVDDRACFERFTAKRTGAAAQPSAGDRAATEEES